MTQTTIFFYIFMLWVLILQMDFFFLYTFFLLPPWFSYVPFKSFIRIFPFLFFSQVIFLYKKPTSKKESQDRVDDDTRQGNSLSFFYVISDFLLSQRFIFFRVFQSLALSSRSSWLCKYHSKELSGFASSFFSKRAW